MGVWKARLLGIILRDGKYESDHIQVRNIDADDRDDAAAKARLEAARYKFEDCSIDHVSEQGRPKKAKLGNGFKKGRRPDAVREASRSDVPGKLSHDDAEAISVVAAKVEDGDDARPAERAAYGNPRTA